MEIEAPRASGSSAKPVLDQSYFKMDVLSVLACSRVFELGDMRKLGGS